MPLSIERIGESLELGEGPHWDVDTQSLYFVNALGKSIHRYVPATKTYTKAVIGGNAVVSFIIPVDGEKNRFVISQGRILTAITWDGINDKITNVEKIGEVENAPETIDNQINDAKADESGRLWFGTLKMDLEAEGYTSPKAGSLYSFGPQRVIKKHLSGITTSNGLAFNEALNKFYYIDSAEGKVFQFDIDVKNGTISNQETIFTLAKHDIPGIPDGQVIDTDGNLWVAVFNGSRVIKIDPRKPETLLQTIEFPTKSVTSATFGGPNLAELYVTTANFTMDDAPLDPSQGHGFTYRVTGMGAKGYPAVKVKI